MKIFSISANIVFFWMVYIVWLGMSFDVFTPDFELLVYVIFGAILSAIFSFHYITVDEIKDLYNTTYGAMSKYIVYFTILVMLFGNLIYWKQYILYLLTTMAITTLKMKMKE